MTQSKIEKKVHLEVYLLDFVHNLVDVDTSVICLLLVVTVSTLSIKYEISCIHIDLYTNIIKKLEK